MKRQIAMARLEQVKQDLRATLAAGKSELQLDTPWRWVVPGIMEPARFFESLSLLMPAEAILFFEGCSVARDVAAFFEHYEAPHPLPIGRDTVFPDSECFHVSFSPEVVSRLGEMTRTRPISELFDHVKGYRERSLLFHFHDAFQNDLLISELVGEAAVAEFCARLGATYRREPNVNKQQEGLKAVLMLLENPSRIRIVGEPWWRRAWRRLSGGGR